MKAEHRKELERNALATKLGEAYEKLKQGPSRTTWIWIGVIGGGITIYLLFRYFMSSSEAADSARWLKVDNAIFAEQIAALKDDKDLKDTEQGRLVRFKEARLKMAEGTKNLGWSRRDSLDKIDEATTLYEELLKKAGRVPLLHQEALYNAAKGNEIRGKVETAREYYEKLIKDYPQSALGKKAEKQLERLKDNADLEKLIKEYGPKDSDE